MAKTRPTPDDRFYFVEARLCICGVPAFIAAVAVVKGREAAEGRRRYLTEHGTWAEAWHGVRVWAAE